MNSELYAMEMEAVYVKKDGLLAEILNAVVKHERGKVKNSKPNYFLDQKKQLWYGLMNSLDEELSDDSAKDASPEDAPKR